jgi:hypothetical protein
VLSIDLKVANAVLHVVSGSIFAIMFGLGMGSNWAI